MALQQYLTDLNPLAHIFTRTRKRDVPIRWPVREAHTIPVTLTDAEMTFYDDVTRFAERLHLRRTASPAGLPFARIMLQRQVASCIPATRDYLKALYAKGEFVVETDEHGDPMGEDEMEDSPTKNSNPLTLEQRMEIEHLLEQLAAMDGRDTKFEALVIALRELFDDGSARKVIIFTFFRRTITYLAERLAAHYPNGVVSIHGGVDPQEREDIIDRFRTAEGIPILLASEVGGEGLDLQFCNAMVNYDLPWNPMRVEQRIGRIDRYGQEHDKVLIYNFRVPGTIDTDIFNRLYTRIGIFERSIGDLEAILGNEVNILIKDVFSGHLSPEQEAERTEIIAQSIIRQSQEMARFEEQSSSLVGADQYFQDEVDAIKRGRRFITGDELQRLIEGVLALYFPATQLVADRKAPGQFFLRCGDDFQQFVTNYLQQIDRSPDIQRLWSLLRRDDPLLLTFDSDVANRQPRVEFVTSRHPLITTVVHRMKASGTTNGDVSVLALRGDQNADYLFFVFLFEGSGLRPSVTLETVVLTLPELEVDDDLSERFLPLIESVEALENVAPITRGDLVERGYNTASGIAANRRQLRESELQRLNSELIDNQLADLRRNNEAQIRWINKLLGSNPHLHPRIVRMRKGQIENLRANLAAKETALEERRGVSVSMEQVAGGILRLVLVKD